MTQDNAFLDFLHGFVGSMPEPYRARYDARSMTEHARVAYGRARRAVAVGSVPCQPAQGGALAVCVVADDRPGLLSYLSAALVLSDLDVVRAEAYTRRRPSAGSEAVDLFWLRRLTPAGEARAPDDEQLARLRALTIALLDGAHDVASLATRHGAKSPGDAAASTTVRMVCAPSGWLDAIEVRSADRPGLLLRITSALFAMRLQIARCEARSVRGRVIDRFYVEELDGAPVPPRRVFEIEQDLIAVLGRPRAVPALAKMPGFAGND